MDLQTFVLLLTTILLSLVVIAISFHKNKSYSSRLLAGSILGLSIWSLTSMINHVTTSEFISLISNRISYGSIIIVLFLGFLYSESIISWQNQEKSLSNKGKIVIGVPSLILLIITLFTDLIIKDSTIRTKEHSESVLIGNLFIAYVAYVISLSIKILFNLYKGIKITKGVKKIHLTYTFIGILIAFLISATTSLVLPLVGINSLGSIAPLGLVVLVGFVYYSIFRYRFLDVRLFLSYLLELTILMIISYFTFYGIVFLDNALFGSIYTPPAIAAGIVYSTLFILVLKFISNFIHKKIIEPRFGYENITVEFNKIIGIVTNKFELTKAFVDYVKDKIGVEEFLIFYFYDNKKILLINTFSNENATFELLSLNDLNYLFDNKVTNTAILAQEITLIAETIENDEIKQKLNEIHVKLQKHNIELLIKLTSSDNKLSGFIALGHKNSAALYSEQEIRILENLVTPFTLALQRSILYEEIENFADTLQTRIEQATRELKEKYEFEKDIIGILGHELRTPLTIIKNTSDLLLYKLSKANKENQKIDFNYITQKLKIIQDAINREANIIETALSTSRIDNNKVQLNLEKVNLLEIANFAINVCKRPAQQKNIKLIFAPTDNFPEFILDPSKIEEIIINLLSNAIKYTHKGWVKLILNYDDKYIYITVKDTGIGIPKEAIPQLGQKFYRINPYSSSGNVVRVGGTGLGLYIIKNYLAMMKGELIIESEVGIGSTFTAKIPIKQNYNPKNEHIVEDAKEIKDEFVRLRLK